MNFYDTCALLNMQEDAFLHGRFYISSITLRELENSKPLSIRTKQSSIRRAI